MKKLRLFTLLALVLLLMLLAFVGCQKEGEVVSISIKDHDPSTAIEVAVGEFEYTPYTVVVVHESGNTEEIALTEDMITETDIFKLYQVGDHDITVNYGKQQYTLKVSVKRHTFDDLKFPENNVFTYNGEAHTIEVDGTLPANATVTYLGGNSFVNAGTYDVVAVVSCEGYVTEKLSTTVKIERAKYDMSGVKFEGKEVVYDGSAHAVAISGTLPEGVSSPTYTINGRTGASAIDTGEYTVKATFTNTDPNYEAIPEMEAKLKITPAEYTVKGVDLIFKSESGNVISNARKSYDGKSVTFDLDDYNKLSKKVIVSFVVYDEDEKVISTSNKKTNIINAGVYTVKVEFTMADGKNYKPISPIVRTFEVMQIDYPTIENIQFAPIQTTYDGEEHSIVIDGTLPLGVTVSYEYYKDGVRLDDADGNPVQSVTDAGRYTVNAVFSHTNMNLKEIPSISAILYIEQKRLSSSDFVFDYNTTWVYDETPKSVVTTRKPEQLEIVYEYYLDGVLVTNADGTPATSVTEVGEYTVKAIICPTSNNYAPMGPITLTFSIVAPNN